MVKHCLSKSLLAVCAVILFLSASVTKTYAITDTVYGFGGFNNPHGEPCFGGSPSIDLPSDWSRWGSLDGNHCIQKETYTRANDGGRESVKITVNPQVGPDGVATTGLYRIVGPLDPAHKYWFVGNSFRYNDNGLLWAARTFCTSAAGNGCADGGFPSWQSVSIDPQNWNHFEFKNIVVPSDKRYLKMYLAGGPNTGNEQTDVYFDDIRVVDQDGGQPTPPQSCDTSNVRLEVNGGKPLGQNQEKVQFMMTNGDTGQGTLNIDASVPSNSNAGLTNCVKTISKFGAIAWSCDVKPDAGQQNYSWNYSYQLCTRYNYSDPNNPTLVGCSETCNVSKPYEIRNVDDAACVVNDYPSKMVNGVKTPVFIQNSRYNGLIVMKNTGNTTWDFSTWADPQFSWPNNGTYGLGTVKPDNTVVALNWWHYNGHGQSVGDNNQPLGWTLGFPYFVPILNRPGQTQPIKPEGSAYFPLTVTARDYGNTDWFFRMWKVANNSNLFSSDGFFGQACQTTINISNDTPATTKLSGRATEKNTGVAIANLVLNSGQSECIGEKTTNANGIFLYPDMRLGGTTCLRAPNILSGIAPDRSYESLNISTGSTLTSNRGTVNNNEFNFLYDIPYCPSLPPTGLTATAEK